MLQTFLLTMCIFIGCGRKHEPAAETPASERLATKKQLYCNLSHDTVAVHGYAVAKCDGLLFTALRGISCGDISVSEFQDAAGRWYRNPAKDCFVAAAVANESDSSISKDMLVGAFANLWHTKNIDAVRRTIDYGQQHNWIMGEAKDDVTLASKCLLSPGLISDIFDIRKKLSGATGQLTTTRTDSADDTIGINTGFRAHLDVLHTLVSGAIHGAVTGPEFETLKAQARRQPRNAMFQAAYARYNDGDQTAATSILLDENLFPSAALPTSGANSCSDYLWQRDDSPQDWAPCPDKQPGVVFEGLDFVVAASIVDGSFLRNGL